MYGKWTLVTHQYFDSSRIRRIVLVISETLNSHDSRESSQTGKRKEGSTVGIAHVEATKPPISKAPRVLAILTMKSTRKDSW
jgi:hypothetical protein